MADIILAKRVIDYVGLGAKGIPESQARLFKELGLNLSLMQGMGSDGAQLIQVDAAGNLKISALGTGINIAQQGGAVVAAPSMNHGFDGQGVGSGSSIQVMNLPYLFNNTNNDRQRSASGANLSAQSSIGAIIATPPGEFTVQSAPAVGARASAGAGAGAAGVRNVCTGFGFGFSAGVAVAATVVIVQLRDGASGAGTIMKQWAFSLAAAIIPPISVEVAGLEIPGSPATAMTLEFTALLANLQEYCNLTGHQAA